MAGMQRLVLGFASLLVGYCAVSKIRGYDRSGRRYTYRMSEEEYNKSINEIRLKQLKEAIKIGDEIIKNKK